ncbi:MAG: undecaprenyl-diphosphate phosphatase [Kiritimatiellae bacterium]|nr:undecaprenyl-diphosphate phosphatase [Kiritimatiellia bacterium]
MFEIVILSILQGIAEFLPISSSGHLVICQHLLGVNEPGMRLDVCLHAGTLISIFAFYAKSIVAIFKRREMWHFAIALLISSIPAVIVYFFFSDEIKGLFENAKMVGALLMFTGAILVGTRYIPSSDKSVSFLRALGMGLGQAIALLPGVSRSGMTLAAARSFGVKPEKAAEFSFLMSTPLIIGAMLLEILRSFDGAEVDTTPWSHLVVGMAIAAIVGYYSLKILVKALKGKWFWLFGPYCILTGLATLIFVGK